jgi:integrase
VSRGNGEGSVYQRSSDGRWVASWTERDVDGAVRRQVLYASSQAEAKRLLRNALNRVALNQPGVDQSIPLEAYTRQWIETTLAVRDVKASTRLVYADALEHWVLPTLGTKRLRDLQPSDIERLLAHLQRRGLSRNSRAMAFKVLRQVLDTAVRDRLVAVSPASGVSGPRGITTPTTRAMPSRQQVRALIEAADPRLRIAVALCAYTGMRVGEALSLLWQDVDLNDPRPSLRITATVTRTLEDDGRRIHVRDEPKTSGSRRRLPVTPSLASELRAWADEQARQRLSAGQLWQETDLVVTTDVGTLWDPSNARKALRPVVAAVGAPGVSFHRLRHAAATLLLEEGVPVKVASELLGHSSTRVTEGIYAHVTQRLVDEAASALERGLS